jgi:hypothetical protein
MELNGHAVWIGGVAPVRHIRYSGRIGESHCRWDRGAVEQYRPAEPCCLGRRPEAAFDNDALGVIGAKPWLHERLGNDPQISDDELVNEDYALEVAIYKVEEDLLLSDMRRFVRAETALSPSSLSFISKVKEFVRSAGNKFVRLGLF